ncbi:TonB protein, C-terminal domain protein [Leptospira inadai serovar Lyme str. 10]|uniref:TonB protein, C-terminal domain protein n=2 Tax=Leptospira inadai serovar Lyme TaxID=293084 RepID=V6HB88_9LEPT|nr:energy transducer TonB [Leptospira inadai]EQA36642.1 TonB protein, C-terminal domain protein [Leptospira inadai serovar Lyme str. 10]PNV74647.1 TonB-dependent receptor [Leptospira inadai serovar Lyme]
MQLPAFFKLEIDKPTDIDEDDRRLLFASFLVFAFASFLVAHLFTRNVLWKILGEDPMVKVTDRDEREKIYEVLLEQDFVDSRVKDEYKALSNVDAAGSGGLTKKEGFHTDSPHREFIWGNLIKRPSQQANPKSSQTKTEEEKVYDVAILKNDPVQEPTKSQEQSTQSSASGRMTKIPFNYRFEQDFLFRWDGGQSLSIPRKKLAGYDYFKRMLRQIEGSFAPPGGGNFGYRDGAGTVVREAIIPGEVRVQFMLNDIGQVIDTKLVSSQGQDMVDRACLDTLRGQNFGTVPEDVKSQGMIFGIRFIFPGFRR